MAERHREPIPLRLPQGKTLEEHLTSWYSILGILVAIFGAGWAMNVWQSTKADLSALEGKADARSVAADHSQLTDDHDRIGKLETHVEDIHIDVRAMREDIRAFAAGRPLPTLTPEPRKP